MKYPTLLSIYHIINWDFCLYVIQHLIPYYKFTQRALNIKPQKTEPNNSEMEFATIFWWLQIVLGQDFPVRSIAPDSPTSKKYYWI